MTKKIKILMADIFSFSLLYLPYTNLNALLKSYCFKQEHPCTIRFISWLVSNMKDLENMGQKKKPFEEKKIFAQKKTSENAFKKYGYHL